LQGIFGVCAWCMKGKKGACKTLNHPFNHFLFIFGCVYVLAGNVRCHNEGPGACKGRGSDQGPVRPSTTSYALSISLHQHCSTHSSTFDCFSPRDPRYDRMAFIEDDSWLACFYCIRHDQSQERALYTMFNMGVTTRLCPPSKI